MRVTVGMLKGGSSRTTTAVCLSLALFRATGERVLLADADPANGTAFEWAEDAAGWPSEVEVVYWPVSSLGRRVEAAMAQGPALHSVIDTGNDAAALRAALEVSDHLVVPLAPSGTESTRLTPTLQVAAEVAGTRPLGLSILLTRTVHNSTSRREARAALEGMGLNVLETEIPRLERFANAYGTAPSDLGAYQDALNELRTITLEKK